MSPLRLLLEGPDLPTLLEQIRSEYGAEARIVQAEKVRRGGVAGFFARERFNIQVEVPHVQAGRRPAPKTSGAPAQSVLDLVDRLNREDEALHLGVANASPTSASRGTAHPVVASAPAFPAPSVAYPSSASSHPVSVIAPSSLSPAPVSTESASFADVMSRLQQSMESGVPAAPAASLTSELPAVADAPRPTMPTPLTSPSAPVTPRSPVRSPLSTGAEMTARATRMGVPSQVLGGAQDPADVYRRLLAWVESRPMAPMVVSTHGQVIVVVGETKDALRVAGSLSRDLEVDPSAIYLAVPASSSGHDVPVGQLLSDVSDIAMRRRRWQHSAGSTIVVVEAALPPAARGWLTAAVSALAPTFTWAVAQASTKVNDVVSWTSEIGHVDALALVNVPATADPAAALAGPLPVGLLDGERATVTRWMSMLTDR